MKPVFNRSQLAGIGKTVFYYFGLGITALGLAVWVLKLWETNLHVPFVYTDGDTVGNLRAIKTILDHGWWWFNSDLGAPFSLSMLAFPVCTNTDFSFFWLIMRFVSDPGMVLNIAYLLSFPICALICAYALRRLGVNSALAWGAALLYAFLPYHFYRHVAHIVLLYYFVPVPCMFAIILASGQVNRLTRYLFTGVAVFLVFIGFNYAYTVFFAAFNILVGLVIGSMKNHSRKLLKYGAGALVILCVVFGINIAPSLWFQRTHEMDKVVFGKSVKEAEIFGLKIRHLVGPLPETSIPGFKTWARKDNGANFPNENENTHARLGGLMALGFIGLLLVFFFNVGEKLRSDATDVLSAARLNLACVLLATVGGFGSIFNLLITPDIRAYNRIVPFIAFYVLFGLGWVLTHLGRRFYEEYGTFRSRLLWGGLLFSLLIFGIYDQSQAALTVTSAYRGSAEMYKSTELLLKKLESEYPSGTMFLQMPLVRFPDNFGQGRLHVQETKPFCWSWGIFSVRQHRWAAELESLPVDQFVRRVVAEGFKAIIFHRDLRMFNKSSVTEMNLKKATGVKPWISPDGMCSVIDLRKEKTREIVSEMKVLTSATATPEEKARAHEKLGMAYEANGAIEQAIEEYRLAADGGTRDALAAIERLCAIEGGRYRGERGCPKPDASEAYDIKMLEGFEGRKEPVFSQWGPNNAKHTALTHVIEKENVYRGKQAERLAVQYAGYEEGKTTEYWMLGVDVPLTRETHLSWMTRGARGVGMVIAVKFAGEHYKMMWDEGADLDHKYQLEEWRAGDMNWDVQVSEDVYDWAKKVAAKNKWSMNGARIVRVGLDAMSLHLNDVVIDNVQAWFTANLVARKKAAAEKILLSGSANAEEKARARRDLDEQGAAYEADGQIEQAIKEYRLAADRGVSGASAALERLCSIEGGKYRGERGCPKPDAREAYDVKMLEDFEGRKEPVFSQWGPNNAKHAALTHVLETKNVYRGKQAEQLAVQYAGYEEGKTLEYWMLGVNVPLTRETHISWMTRGTCGVGMAMVVKFAGEHYEMMWDNGSDLDRKYQLEEWCAGDLDWQVHVSEDVYARAKQVAAAHKWSMDGARIVRVGLDAMSLNQNDVVIDNVQAWFKVDLVAKKKAAAEKVLLSGSASTEEKARARRDLDELGVAYEKEGQIEQAIKEYRLAADRGVSGALAALERLCVLEGGKYRGERGCPKPDASKAYKIKMLEDFEGRKEPAFSQWGPNNTKHAALTHVLETKNVYRGKQAERLAVQYAGYEEGKTTEYWMLDVDVPLARETHLSWMTRGARGVGMAMVVQFAGEHYEMMWDKGSDLNRKYQLEEWYAGDMDWQVYVSEDVYAWAKRTAKENGWKTDGMRIVRVGLHAASLNQNNIMIDNVQAWYAK